MPSSPFHDEGNVPPPLVGGSIGTGSEDPAHHAQNILPSPPLSSLEEAYPMSEDEDDEIDDDEHNSKLLYTSLYEATTLPSSPSWAAITSQSTAVSPQWLRATALQDAGATSTSNDQNLSPFPITIVDPATQERLHRQNSGRNAGDRIVQVPQMVSAVDGSNSSSNTTATTNSTTPSLKPCWNTLERTHQAEDEEATKNCNAAQSCPDEHYHHPYRDRASPGHRRRSLRHRHCQRQGRYSWPISHGTDSSTTARGDEEDRYASSLQPSGGEEKDGLMDGGRCHGHDQACGRCSSAQPFGRLDHHHHHPCFQTQAIGERTSNNHDTNSTCTQCHDRTVSADLFFPRPFVHGQTSYNSRNTPEADAASAHMYDSTEKDDNNSNSNEVLLRSVNRQGGQTAALPTDEMYFLGDDIPVQPSWVIEQQQCRLQPPLLSGHPADQRVPGPSFLSPRFYEHPSLQPSVHEPPNYQSLTVPSDSPRSFSSSLLLRSFYFPQPAVEPKAPSTCPSPSSPHLA